MDGLDEIIRSGIIILLFSSFLKVAVSFSILAFGFGLDRLGMGVASLSLALIISFVVMGSGDNASPALNKVLEGKALNMSDYKPFITKHADPELVKKFTTLAKKTSPEAEPTIELTSVAFLVTELREAFSLGFMLLVPLVIIDILVVNLLMALGVTQISSSIISVPLKILLFVAVDGWALITERILSSYI